MKNLVTRQNVRERKAFEGEIIKGLEDSLNTEKKRREEVIKRKKERTYN